MIDAFEINFTKKSPDDETAVGVGVAVELSDERNRRRVKVELLQQKRKKEITKDINNRLKSTLVLDDLCVLLLFQITTKIRYF